MSMQDMEGYDEVVQKFLATLSPEQRLAGMPPEQVLSQYPAEQRLAGLPPSSAWPASTASIKRWLCPSSFCACFPTSTSARSRPRCRTRAAVGSGKTIPCSWCRRHSPHSAVGSTSRPTKSTVLVAMSRRKKKKG